MAFHLLLLSVMLLTLAGWAPRRLVPDRAGARGPARRKASYGVDAPYLLPVLALLAGFNIVNGVIAHSPWSFVGAAAIVACSGLGLHASLRGKFVVWGALLEQLKLRGHEQVLDIGCGRGAVLMMAAGRLTTGRAVGVDIWNRRDQSGNAAEATRQNARVEGVSERVELCTADMTALPFEAGRFDLVVSNIAVHNVKGRAARAKAIAEAFRVLRPGGVLMVADLWGTTHYCQVLATLGAADIERRGLGWRMWWSGPWLATRLVTARKPAAVGGE
jgi:SAM-dependent methyltransferase